MPAHRKPRCGFCLKELSNAKYVQLHIINTPKCRKARDRELNRRSPPSSVDTASDSNSPDEPMVVDNPDGFADHTEADSDYNPNDQSAANDDMISNQLQSGEEDEGGDRPGRYAEEYNLADVAHILRKSRTDFEALKQEQIYAGLGKKPWAPFEDEDEWQLARFLIKEVSQTATNKYLKLSIVRKGSCREKRLD
jgi:hypothetical protein